MHLVLPRRNQGRSVSNGGISGFTFSSGRIRVKSKEANKMLNSNVPLYIGGEHLNFCVWKRRPREKRSGEEEKRKMKKVLMVSSFLS